MTERVAYGDAGVVLASIAGMLNVLLLLRQAAREHHEVVHDERTITIYPLEAFFTAAVMMNVWACVLYGVGNTSVYGWAKVP